jgi:hypothetical protein
VTARTYQKNATRALTVLAAAALASGLGAMAAPSAQAATVGSDLTATVGGGFIDEVGGQARFAATFNNGGPAVTGDWTFTVTLPAVVAEEPELVAFEEDQGTCDVAGRVVTCTGTGLPVGSTFSFIVQVTGLTPGSQEVTAVASTASDPEPGNNTDTGVITVGPVTAGSGDWGTSGSGEMAPGSSQYYDVAFTCLSAGGCDYGPGMTITDEAINGGSFSPGTNHLYINDTTNVGDCTVTAATISCSVHGTGSVAQGDVLSSRTIGYLVASEVPPQTQVFAQTLGFPADWTGNDTSNDVYPIFTPAEVGAPVVSGQGLAAAAGVVLLGAGGVMLRRRQLQGVQNAA